MQPFFRRLSRRIVTNPPVPEPHRTNFRNLYWDVAWYGVLNGSTISFLTIYATRQGASEMQLGLINAIPAVINLLFAIPVAAWLSRRSMRRGVFLSAVAYRFFYLLLIPLPALLLPAAEVWIVIGITLLMAVPGTALQVGFNSLFAEAVPIEWRGHVTGIRNALLAFSTTVSTLLCGYMLAKIQFPFGYHVVFALGFLGGLMSTIYLARVRPVNNYPGQMNTPGAIAVKQSALRGWVQRNFPVHVLRGSYGVVMLLFFLFHYGQYVAIPVFPIFSVNELRLNDQVISIGTGLFNVATFFGSLQLAKVVRRLGNKRVMVIGASMLGIYPFLFALAHGIGLFLLASLVGGLTWALVGGAMFNFLLEKVPDENRAPYLAVYTLVLNAAVLIGSFSGPALAQWVGLRPAMIAFALVRWGAAVAFWRWGGEKE
ncbi:MAG TPA: MFS transporter [Anaerolineaceae bacterium]